MNRREFGALAAAGTMVGLSSVLAPDRLTVDAWNPDQPPVVTGRPLRVQPILAYQVMPRRPKTSWRSWSDIITEPAAAEEARRIAEELESLSAKADFPVRFLPLAKVTNQEQAAETIAATGRPTLYVGDLYGASGEFLLAYAASRRHGPKVAAVTSSRFEDVAEAVRCFELLKQPGGSVDSFVAACDAARKKSTPLPSQSPCTADPLTTVDVGGCLQKLRESTILAIGTQRSGLADAISSVFRTKVLTMDFDELNVACRQADPQEARKWADRWIGEAERVIEPSRATIEKSGAVYLAMRALMQRHHAQAITINCLGGFYGGHLDAYPCLGYRQLNNDGLVGACEADLLSTTTMLALTYLVNRPGFISDPILDTSTNRVIYIHCVAPTKVFGPQGPTNPFHIRSHAEDGQGAAIRSLMPLGYLVSTLQLHPQRKEVIFHQGKTVENVDEPRVCRTKLAAEVRGDIDKLMNYWDQWGWHRVTAYGDLKEPIRQVAQSLGMKMVEEA